VEFSVGEPNATIHLIMNGTHPKRGSIRGVEVRGEVLRGVIAGMGVFQTKALKLLNESGITEPRGHRWYPLESLILVFNKLADEGGVNLLRIIGASVIQNAQWPKEIDSLSKALYSVNTSYHMNHRRDGKELFDPVLGKTIEGGIGHNVIVPPTPDQNRVLYICDSFYPCEFDFGMASAFVRKFKPAGCSHHATIRHDAGRCRSRGGESCTFIIEW